MTGTVFDIGYRSYTGAREGRGRSRLALFRDGVRASLGLGPVSYTHLTLPTILLV